MSTIRPVSGHPAPVRTEVLPAGAEVVRLFKHTEPFSPVSFNPFPVRPDYPHKRGRYSSTNSYWYPCVYFADKSVDEATAVVEMFDDLDRGRDDNGKDYLTRAEAENWSFCYSRTTVDLELAYLETEQDAKAIGARLSVLQGNNQQLSRAWARHVRLENPEVQGISYTSARRKGGTPALVLFPKASSLSNYKGLNDRLSRTPPAPLEPPYDVVAATDPQGSRIFRRLIPVTGLVPLF